MREKGRMFERLIIVAGCAAMALAAAGSLTGSSAASGPDEQNNAQVAEIYRLQAAFHQAASYGGDINAMAPLWADDATLTTGGNVYTGKAAILDFLAHHTGAFQHYWVSLAPSFKTAIDLQGDTAEIYFECHYADPSVHPYVLQADLSLGGTVKKENGHWVLWHMSGGPVPL